MKFEVGHAEANPSPDVGLAAVSPDARQIERLSLGGEIGLFLFIEVELRRASSVSKSLVRFERKHVRPEAVPVELAPGVQNQDLDPFSGQVPGGHASGRTASDDDNVMGLWLAHHRHQLSSGDQSWCSGWVQPSNSPRKLLPS